MITRDVRRAEKNKKRGGGRNPRAQDPISVSCPLSLPDPSSLSAIMPLFPPPCLIFLTATDFFFPQKEREENGRNDVVAF